jgi:Spy/CpxP family protein refolding chaperone
MKRPEIKLAAALVGMFLLGFLTGAGMSMFVYPPSFLGTTQAEEIQKHVQSFLTDKLSLTAEQQAQITPITSDFAQQAQSLRVQTVNQFLQLCQSADDRIRPLLTPDQKLKLDKLAEERKEMVHSHGLPPGQ